MDKQIMGKAQSLEDMIENQEVEPRAVAESDAARTLYAETNGPPRPTSLVMLSFEEE
ncbi:MAG: hypothetical protein V6Z86_07525 [Hyphomicrobiales bacterium]